MKKSSLHLVRLNRFYAKKFLFALMVGWLFLPHAKSTTPVNPALHVPTEIQSSVREIAYLLEKNCPVKNPGDINAFGACRQFMLRNNTLRNALNDYVHWGRRTNMETSLKETRLTQFSPDVLMGLYLSLFMYQDNPTVIFHEKENLVLATIPVRFRNALSPGLFPYPFWHEEAKWKTYEHARNMQLWIEPKTRKIQAIQFTAIGEKSIGEPLQQKSPPPFDGKWEWVDQQGQPQPSVTFFDGYFRPTNPYKPAVTSAYRTLALSLREGQCLQCHVPNNPDRMSRLVLLQTPMHAAGEIKRVLAAIKKNSMPVDELGIEQPLDPHMKKVLLEHGNEFDRLLDLARAWEQVNEKNLIKKAQ